MRVPLDKNTKLSGRFISWLRLLAIGHERLKRAKKRGDEKAIKKACGDISTAERELARLKRLSRLRGKLRPRRGIGKRQRDRQGLTRRGRLEYERKQDPGDGRRREQRWQ